MSGVIKDIMTRIIQIDHTKLNGMPYEKAREIVYGYLSEIKQYANSPFIRPLPDFATLKHESKTVLNISSDISLNSNGL